METAEKHNRCKIVKQWLDRITAVKEGSDMMDQIRPERAFLDLLRAWPINSIGRNADSEKDPDLFEIAEAEGDYLPHIT